MSLRAKCLPQKSGLQSKSATKPPTFNTSVKRSTLKRCEKTILLKKSAKNNQLTRKSLAKKRTVNTTQPHRNVRTIIKRKAVLSSTEAASSSKISKSISTKKISINKTSSSGATKSKNTTGKIKTCNRFESSASSSSISCSRSGRKLVPARCACANDSVTTRCSIHNNVQQQQQRQSTASSTNSSINLKSSHNLELNTNKKGNQDLLSAGQKKNHKQQKTMSSVAIPIHGSSTTTTSSSSSTVSDHLTSNKALYSDRQKPNEELFHEDQSFSSVTYKDAVLQAKNSSLVEGKTKVTATPGLPSPTESISETSDYQRSTPSPKDEVDSDLGNTMGEWPTNTDSQDKGSIPDSDQGFGEEENKNSSDNANDTNQVPLVLQQLCAALQKMPEKIGTATNKTNSTNKSSKPTSILNNNSSLSSQVSPNNANSLPTPKQESQKITENISEDVLSSIQDAQSSKSILGKRRKSMQSNMENELSSKSANTKSLSNINASKKRKTSTEEELENSSNTTKTGNIVPQSQPPSHYQGKITQYLPEMKDSSKKEKLDKTINLNTCSAKAMDPSSKHNLTPKIKTELSVTMGTNVEVEDAEEGVLVIDDVENTPSPEERMEEDESCDRSSLTSEAAKASLIDDIKYSIIETDLKKCTTNETILTNDVTSLKSNTEYSDEINSKPSSSNISSENASRPDEVPLNAYIKEEDIKHMPMSPLPCSSSSSGISSTSSSGSLKDDSCSDISISRMSSASSSGASSYTKDYDHLFEMPRTIRFPAPSSSSGGIVGLNRNGGKSVTRISRSDSTENGTNNNNLTETVICKWELCGQEFDSNGKLLDHLKTVHARCDYGNKTNNNNNTFEENEGEKDSTNESTPQYKCLWEGCKVYGKGSSTKSWLEKHVIANHGGSKPFQCIVDGCKERFGTQTLLERHVNGHFKSKTSSTSSSVDGNSTASSSMHSSSSSTNPNNINKLSKNSLSTNSNGHNRLYHNKLARANKKLMAPNGKRLKYRKTIYSARIFDLFDLGVMAQVRQRITAFESGCQKLRSDGLIKGTEEVSIKKVNSKEKSKRKEDKSMAKSDTISPKTKNNCGVLDQIIEFRSEILAKRTDEDGQVRVLLQWIPNGIFENEWSLSQNALTTKSVKMSSLTAQQRLVLSNEILQLGEPRGRRSETAVVRCSERRGRKTKAPQSRSSALS